jgi:hypothetical protein
MRSHPDRHAATLALAADASARAGPGPFAAPGPGACDARIALKQLAFAALRAAERSQRARARLAPFDPAVRPDLWAGTVQDGTARGFAVALEEAVSLAETPPPAPDPFTDPVKTQVFTSRELRKKKDLLVASAGARIRFSRKEGVLFVDRDAGVNSPNCVRFEDRSDAGTLDGFVPREDERPRLFSAQFVQPVRYRVCGDAAELQLRGRLGRGPRGCDCELTFRGRPDAPRVELSVTVRNVHFDHRLRIRFLGIPGALLHHDCTDVRELVESDAGGFIAFTLVRACGRLLVDGGEVAVPDAQCLGSIAHRFELGG